MSEPHPGRQLSRMILGCWTSRAIYVAAKLRVADHLADGPRSAEEHDWRRTRMSLLEHAERIFAALDAIELEVLVHPAGRAGPSARRPDPRG
jgi:hypothetical protein